MTPASERPAGPARERGQAIPMLLLLMASLLAGFLLVFDAGQLVTAKLRLQGAADAAAYSAAQWQARTLNYQAYVNRAMVANEVAIAQSVSLRSWSRYVARLLQNAATVGTLIPPVGAALRSVEQAWANVDRGLQRVLPPIESATSRWNVSVLAGTQQVAATLTGPVAVDLARRVAQANVPDAGWARGGESLLLADARRAQSFTTGFARRGDERTRLRDVVLSSRDGFSASRGWSLGFGPFGLRKRGGTDLIAYDSWRGMDTVADHVPALFGSSEHPIAWGAAENRRSQQGARGFHGGSWRDNPRSSRLANNAMQSSSSYQGMPGYRDLAATRGSAPANASVAMRFEAALFQPAGTLATSERVLGGPRTVVPGEAERGNEAAYAAGGLLALSAAEVAFVRPQGRSDGRRELPSLFNPYWQARLAPASRSQRALVDASGAGPGLAGDPFLLPGVAP
jgi:Flp pilus assembly protein TadG